MTVFGPVMYDRSYPDKLLSGKAYACRWLAHDSSNEIRTFINWISRKITATTLMLFPRINALHKI